MEGVELEPRLMQVCRTVVNVRYSRGYYQTTYIAVTKHDSETMTSISFAASCSLRQSQEVWVPSRRGLHFDQFQPDLPRIFEPVAHRSECRSAVRL